MYVHMSDLMDEPAAITTTVTPTGVAGIDAVDAALVRAGAISGPLAGSPSQNEARRRDLALAGESASLMARNYADYLAGTLAWGAESAAFLRVQEAAALLVQAPNSKASWAELDAQVRAAQALFSTARAAIFSRARLEGQALVDKARSAVASLKAKTPMDDADWAAVDALLKEVSTTEARLAKLPFEAKDATAFAKAGGQLYDVIEARVAAASTAFANKAEELLVQRASLVQPQQGRKIANWIDRNKVYVGVGTVGVLAFLRFGFGKQD